MDIDQVKAFCKSLPGSIEQEQGAPSNLLSYKVGGKKFAYFKTSEPEQWRFSFRTTAARFVELTEQPGIKPARYMHRFHWLTLVHVKSIPEVHLKELVHWSYTKALCSLPKKVQADINA